MLAGLYNEDSKNHVIFFKNLIRNCLISFYHLTIKVIRAIELHMYLETTENSFSTGNVHTEDLLFSC
jgi:hypothetical protein